MAHIAFVSCFVEVAEQLVTPTGGYFPMLTRLSPYDFDPTNPQAPRLDTFQPKVILTGNSNHSFTMV